MQSTNLQLGYQELMKFLRTLHSFLKTEMKEFEFSNGVVENNMDYSYFQFTDKVHKEKGLKFVVVFIHKSFEYNVWLSGYNRKTQKRVHEELKDQNMEYELTTNPGSTDYILRQKIVANHNYDELELMLMDFKDVICRFVSNN